MRSITQEQADEYQANGFNGHSVGCYSEEYGAVIGDDEFIIYITEDGKLYLAHRLEFEFNDVFVRPYHPENTTPLPNFDDVFEVDVFEVKEL